MPEWTISKRFSFSASHQLPGLPEGHPCGRLHGHNYSVSVELTAKQLDATGFIRDFGDLRVFRNYIDERLDHRHLNDVLDVSPTCENLAQHLLRVARAMLGDVVTAVAVSETEATWARYSE